MLDVAYRIKSFIGGNWTEDDPLKVILNYAYDEFNPNDPAIQILFQNLPDLEWWITHDIYRHEQQCKITIYLRPVNYMPATIDKTKITFLNMKNEINRILTYGKFLINNISSIQPSGWKDIDFETRGSGKKEPIVFVAEMIVKCIYYEGELKEYDGGSVSST